MIILDTNVISALMTPAPADRRLLAWLDEMPRQRLATTAVNYAESLYGVEKLDRGQRKKALYVALHRIYSAVFNGRIVPFDSQAAQEFSLLVNERKQAGQPLLEFDAQIAAIARARKMAIATRDSDFADCGVTVINPWNHPA